MDKQQLESLQTPFSPSDIRQREGSFGKTLDYIEAHSVIARLNDALTGDWSFEVVSWEVNDEADEVIVLGKLSAGSITKMQIGGSKRKRHKQSGNLVSLGDDIKAAASDALKKCATLLGVGLHLYRSEEAVTHPAAQHSEPPPTRHPSAPRQQQQPISTTTTGNRLTAKQKSLIMKLAVEAGLSHPEITQHCQDVYGRTVDFLSKADASKLIENLFSGQVKAA